MATMAIEAYLLRQAAIAAGLVVATAGIATTLDHPASTEPRSPAVTLESDARFWGFGSVLAAHGAVLASWDVSAGCRDGAQPCRTLVRIARVDRTQVTEEARIEVPGVEALAARDDLVAVRTNGEQIVLYARDRSRWRLVEKVAVDQRCQGEIRSQIFLDDDVLVATGSTRVCIYQYARKRWRLAEVIARSSWHAVAMTRDRVVVLTSSELQIYERRRGGWKRDREIESPADSIFVRVGMNRRWIVAAGFEYDPDRDEGVARLFVYDRQRNDQLVATLPAVGEMWRSNIAVSDSNIVAADQLWHFDGRAWSEEHLPTYAGGVAIGDLIWIGKPGSLGDWSTPGQIDGFTTD